MEGPRTRGENRPNGISVKENFSTLPLKPEDAIKIRFGNKWYHGEMLESWNPLPERIDRAEKGIFQECLRSVEIRFITLLFNRSFFTDLR